MVPKDVPFTTDAAPPPEVAPVIVSTTPGSGTADFNITSNLTVVMDKICSGTTSTMDPVVRVVSISGTAFTGTTTFDATGKKTFTFNPSSDLRYSMIHTIKVSGIYDTGGRVMTPVDVPFTTADPALTPVYSVTPTISTHQLDSTYYILGEKRDSSSSALDTLKIRQVKVYLKRTGTPNTVVKVVIRQNIESTDTNHVTIGTIQSTSLTTSFQQYKFTNLSNSYALTTNDLVGVWADNAALSNSNTIGVQTGAGYDGTDSFFTKEGGGGYNDSTSQDLAGDFYT